jgi:hypothetical protein
MRAVWVERIHPVQDVGEIALEPLLVGQLDCDHGFKKGILIATHN